MGNRTRRYPTALLAMYFAAPAVSVAASSRPDWKSGREGGGRVALALAVLTTAACLLITLCGAPVAFAKSGRRVARPKPAHTVRKLRAMYALDESVEKSDGRLIRRRLRRLLSNADVRLFLRVIKKAEAGEPGLMVGGCRAPSLKKHPALLLPRRCCYPVKGYGCSTASGNYQLTLQNWRKLTPFLELEDFSETNQALAALELIRRGGGAADAYTAEGLALKRRIQGGFLKLLLGDVNSALCMATYDWASSSCSTLPAGHRFVYAELADEMRKSDAREARVRREARGGPRRGTRVPVKADLRSPGRAGKAGAPQAKGPKAGDANARGRE